MLQTVAHHNQLATETVHVLYDDPYRRLGAMVILQAIKDATSAHNLLDGGTRLSALYFLLEDRVDFPFWCRGLGLDHRIIRARLIGVIRKHETRTLLKEFDNVQVH